MTQSRHSLRVVVIDDSPEDQAEVKRLLRENVSRRFTVFPAESGAEGIRAVLGGEEGLPDCVVLDYTLPDMIAPEVVLAAMDKQLSDLRADLARIQECAVSETQTAGSRFVVDYGNAVLTASVTCLEQKRAELLRLMSVTAAAE